MLLIASVGMAQNDNQVSQSQRKAPKEMSTSDRTEMMVKQLGLSSEQKTKVKALNEKYANAFKGPGMNGGQPPRQSTNSSQKTKKSTPPQASSKSSKTGKQSSTIQKQQAAYEKELKKILSDSQYSKYQQMRKGRGSRTSK